MGEEEKEVEERKSERLLKCEEEIYEAEKLFKLAQDRLDVTRVVHTTILCEEFPEKVADMIKKNDSISPLLDAKEEGEEEEEVDNRVLPMNNEMDNKKKPPALPPRTEMAEPSSTLFIGNLEIRSVPVHKVEENLREIFSTCGPLQKVRLGPNNATFAHCQFIHLEDAIKAYHKFDNYLLNGRTMRVDFAHTPQEKQLAGKQTGKFQRGRASSSFSRERPNSKYNQNYSNNHHQYHSSHPPSSFRGDTGRKRPPPSQYHSSSPDYYQRPNRHHSPQRHPSPLPDQRHLRDNDRSRYHPISSEDAPIGGFSAPGVVPPNIQPQQHSPSSFYQSPPPADNGAPQFSYSSPDKNLPYYSQQAHQPLPSHPRHLEEHNEFNDDSKRRRFINFL
uniref:RRM domain-containing protein n=1 Tax=Aureoumbra lagunensis TaxID=44058 RepID=A0A7S3K403_9STRA|mmetsp:Transcript_20809/g.26934  ORF Transcript_20809/g.26934 Transcript_20809/m.26934 type:complete len:389 (-) Transcript_20809:331-1497(-)|eukprot:CAMPEP_0197313216 /NCGR_PEP_ID=MMETSP0891-20130614/25962_1 /TAXON_ID=44058 ORGANISM="Aureoumbra lagunensis, Strain CCMP1510" /NCGR_SAMPLE_ID=MMETSP0891 /ASSEMBLY_ACC=CAM_ASM_000534 /LENGTH=388 /DNA_ID=CAMNT_0042800899 /DNA_START=23 /DNA_END=1189 /DNA_ORIENTATION=+